MRLSRWGVVGVLLLATTSVGQASPASGTGATRFADVLTRTRVAFQPLAIATGFGSAWVANDLGVSRVDPETGKITAELGVGAVAGVAVSHTGVFISSYAGDEVARVDPATAMILWITYVRGPMALAVGAGAVWASSPMSGTITRIDPGTGAVVDTIVIQRHVPAALGFGGEPDDQGFAPGLAVGFSSVWVASRSVGRLLRIDPVSDRVIARIRTEGTNPYGVAVGNGAVWVTDYGTESTGYVDETFISRVDPATEHVNSYPLPDYGNQVAVGGGAVWVSSSLGVLRIDPGSGSVNSYLEIRPLPSFPSFGLWAIAFGSGRLWATTLHFESSIDDVLFQVDSTRSLHRPSVPPIIEPGPGVLPVHITKNVPLTRGHACTTPGPDCRQSADVYAPTAPGSHPVIVLAHEQCGQAGCKHYLATLADVLAIDGAVVFNADFGDPQLGLNEGGLKHRDLACAVRYARARATEFGGDPTRVTLVSHLSASRSGAAVALNGNALVGDNCLVRQGSAMPNAFVGLADAPAPGNSPPLGHNRAVKVRLIIGALDAKVAPEEFLRVRAFLKELVEAGYDAALSVVPNGAYTYSPATHSTIDVGSTHPNIRIILDAARGQGLIGRPPFPGWFGKQLNGS